MCRCERQARVSVFRLCGKSTGENRGGCDVVCVLHKCYTPFRPTTIIIICTCKVARFIFAQITKQCAAPRSTFHGKTKPIIHIDFAVRECVWLRGEGERLGTFPISVKIFTHHLIRSALWLSLGLYFVLCAVVMAEFCWRKQVRTI